MPHTNRKKKTSETSETKTSKITHIKRQHVEGSDGWIHVVGEQKVLKGGSKFSRNVTAELINAQHSFKTLEEIASDFERYKKQWENSDACGELKQLLIQREDIASVVCLGLGSLQQMSTQLARTSHIQLAALLTILDVLGLSETQKVIQDPNFTELDKQFLGSLDFETVQDPEAFARIGSNTLVYAPHCYPDIYQKIGNGDYPAVLIGNNLTYGDQWGSTGGEDLDKALKSLSEEYVQVKPFPQLSYDFSDTVIYSRKGEFISS